MAVPSRQVRQRPPPPRATIPPPLRMPDPDEWEIRCGALERQHRVDRRLLWFFVGLSLLVLAISIYQAVLLL